MEKLFVLFFVFMVSIPVSAQSIISDSIAILEDRGFLNCSHSSYSNRISDYDYNKLAEAEEYLFGENYANENLLTRIEQLEDNIFGKRYSNTSLQQRVNNITHNYNRTADSYNSYKKTKFRNVLDSFNQTFFGVPTGYTPPIYTNPYYERNNNWRYKGYNDYYGRNRWHGYQSSMGSNRTGVRIIE